jgi:hypothetical protein
MKPGGGIISVTIAVLMGVALVVPGTLMSWTARNPHIVAVSDIRMFRAFSDHAGTE